MAQIIQHNIMSLNAFNKLSTNNSLLSKNLEKLSSGYKINRAGDDAAGLAISEKMRSQITGLNKAIDNSQDGISLIQTAEGALTEVHSMLNRMVELATQAANGTYNETNRTKIADEVATLNDEIDRIASETTFNGKKLLNGDLIGGKVGKFGHKTDTYAAGDSTTVGVNAFTLTVSHEDASATAPTIEVKIALGTKGDVGAAVITTTSGAVEVTLTLATETTSTISQADINAAIKESANASSLPKGLKLTLDNTIRAKSTATGATFAAGITTIAAVDDRTGADLQLQIGDTSSQQIKVGISAMDATALGVKGISIANEKDANAAIDTINNAIEEVSAQRSRLGAAQNRLEHTINNLTTTTENLTNAESRIRDTDMAKEMMAYTKNNVLAQAAQAMLAQANQQPQQILQLLR